MKEIRFGLIGTGVPGQMLDGLPQYNGIAEWHAHYINETEGARVVACASRTEEHARRFADKFGIDYHIDYRELLQRDDVDAVSICTASGAHGEVLHAAAEAGKHVVVEKPLEVTLEKCDAAIEACDRAGVALCVTFPVRYNPAIAAIKRAIDRGDFGKLICGTAMCRRYRDEDYYAASQWRGTWQWDGGGACMNQGSHTIDTFLWFFGPVESVYAQSGTLGHSALEVEDVACATLRFKSGALATLQCTTCAYPDFGEYVAVHGEKGSVVWGGMPATIQSWDMMDPGFTFNPEDYEMRKEPYAGHRYVYADVVDAIRNRRSPQVDGREGRKAVELILSMYESAATGRAVSL